MFYEAERAWMSIHCSCLALQYDRIQDISNLTPKLLSCLTIIIIIMVILKCHFSREHIALSYKKWCKHRIMKNQQIKSTANDGKSYMK